MFRIEELKAGDFIDLDNYYREFEKGINDSEMLFFNILNLEVPKIEQDFLDFFKEYDLQMLEIKESYEFIYNPPPMPTTIDSITSSIGDEYRKEFSEMYGGYVENVYLLSTIFRKLPNEILEMNILDFLFWANYLNHKRWCEQIK